MTTTALDPATAPSPTRPRLPDAEAHALVAAAARRAARRLPERASLTEEDLYQEGLLALLDAATDFDPDRGVPFAAYARTRIGYAMAAAARADDPLPERSRTDLARIHAARESLASQAITDPTATQIAEASGLSPARVALVLGQHHRSRALALPDWDTDAAPDRTSAPVEDAVLDTDLLVRLYQALGDLPVRTRLMLTMRYVDDLPVGVVAASFGVSAGRISQITTTALAALRDDLAAD